LRLSQGPDAWLTSDRSVERGAASAASKAHIAPRIVMQTARPLAGYRIRKPAIVDGTGLRESGATGASGDTLDACTNPAPGHRPFDLLNALRICRAGGCRRQLFDWPRRPGAFGAEIVSGKSCTTIAWLESHRDWEAHPDDWECRVFRIRSWMLPLLVLPPISAPYASLLRAIRHRRHHVGSGLQSGCSTPHYAW